MKKWNPVTYFGPALDPPLGGYGQETLMHLWCHEHFIPTKFHIHPLSGSVVKVNCDPKHFHALVQPPPSPKKVHKNYLTFLKHLNLLYQHSSICKHLWKSYKIDVE